MFLQANDMADQRGIKRKSVYEEYDELPAKTKKKDVLQKDLPQGLQGNKVNITYLLFILSYLI